MTMETAFTSGQLTKLIGVLAEEGVTHDRFQSVLESGVLGDIFSAGAVLKDRVAICQAIGVNAEERGMLFLEVPYHEGALEELFKLSGCYCSPENENVALSKIPHERGPGQFTLIRFEARMFKFRDDVSLRNVRRRMRASGWTPAGHEHLLALLAKYRMGAKPIDPVGGNKLIALAQPATIAFTLAGPSGCNRAMKEYVGEEGHYGPYAPMFYLGIRRFKFE